jgi:hypothetical protein
MRKLLIAIALALASTAVAQAQIFSATVRYQFYPFTAEDTCNTRQPVYIVPTKQLCKCNTDTRTWMCELASVDKLLLGSVVEAEAMCIESVEIAGRKGIEFTRCLPDEPNLLGSLVPLRFREADLPICDGAIEGVRVYLLAEPNNTPPIPGRYAECRSRADGTCCDWNAPGSSGLGVAP